MASETQYYAGLAGANVEISRLRAALAQSVQMVRDERAALAEAERLNVALDGDMRTLLEEQVAISVALRSELARKVAALRDIAIAPCLFELLGEGEECEDSCPGCRARAALASPTAESTT